MAGCYPILRWDKIRECHLKIARSFWRGARRQNLKNAITSRLRPGALNPVAKKNAQAKQDDGALSILNCRRKFRIGILRRIALRLTRDQRRRAGSAMLVIPRAISGDRPPSKRGLEPSKRRLPADRLHHTANYVAKRAGVSCSIIAIPKVSFADGSATIATKRLG